MISNMRRVYIDNLKWMFIFLLIPYHAAMAWNVWGEPNYIFFEGNKIISSIVVFLNPYFMPFMFLAAGISTRFALQKRTIRQYLVERLKRLLMPFVFGTLLIMPLMTYIADKFNCGYHGNLFEHYLVFFHKFTDLTGADGGFSVGQFWFILYLFLISCLSLGLIVLQKKVMPECRIDLPLWMICLFGLPLPFLHELLSIGGKSIAEYMYMFLTGYYIFSSETISKTENYKWLFLCIGSIAAFLYVYFILWSAGQYPMLKISKYVSEWFMSAGLLGIGKKYFLFHGKVSQYMTKRSYGFYVFHYICIVLMQYVMYQWYPENIVLLYMMPVLGAYCLTFMCCEICIRIPILHCFI